MTMRDNSRESISRERLGYPGSSSPQLPHCTAAATVDDRESGFKYVTLAARAPVLGINLLLSGLSFFLFLTQRAFFATLRDNTLYVVIFVQSVYWTNYHRFPGCDLLSDLLCELWLRVYIYMRPMIYFRSGFWPYYTYTLMCRFEIQNDHYMVNLQKELWSS